jgi:predicted transcriptional regulator
MRDFTKRMDAAVCATLDIEGSLLLDHKESIKRIHTRGRKVLFWLLYDKVGLTTAEIGSEFGVTRTTAYRTQSLVMEDQEIHDLAEEAYDVMTREFTQPDEALEQRIVSIEAEIVRLRGRVNHLVELYRTSSVQ